MRRLTSFLIACAIALPAGATTTDYVGIGLRVRDLGQHRFEVYEFLPGSSAKAAGIHVGNVILQVNGKSTSTMTLSEVYGQLGAPEHQSVSLQVQATGGGRATTVRVPSVHLTLQCFMEGKVTLQLQGSPNPFLLAGTIGDDHLEMHRAFSEFTGVFKGRGLSLHLFVSPAPPYPQPKIQGFILDNPVNWNVNGSKGGSSYQPCIY